MPDGPLTLALAAMALPTVLASAGDSPITFCCASTNDLYRVARESGLKAPRFDNAQAAVDAAAPGVGVLLLADDYPEQAAEVPAAALEAARAKQLRLFIEYPGALPGIEIGAPVDTHWERAVIASEFFGDSLAPMTILAIHGCRYTPVAASGPSIVVARVAGYDSAVYGLPESASPLLFEWPDANALVATTGLSHFVTGRYGPQAAWSAIWSRVLQWLAPDAEFPEIHYTPTVQPMLGPDDPLPSDAEKRAFRRGAQWFHKSRLLVDESWAEELAVASRSEEGALPADRASGDGSLGLLEGYSAHVRHDGSQPLRQVIRNDCLGEGAMALAFDSSQRSRRAAENLCDFICFDSLVQQGIRAEPTHPCFGLMSWGITSYAWERAFYGDDNARALLGLIASSALLESGRWEESITRALLANLRTTGAFGFRGSRIDIPELEANGWKPYHDREIVNYASHYESYLWACYLWAYRATGHREFLDKAENAIRMTIEAGEEQWSWTNGVIQERARILLCLAWLVRIDDTPEHRGWVTSVARDLLTNQVACGAIREELGDPERGQYGAVTSNEAYGTTETPLIQQNGDPACDMLYTTNFAFLGLHEAAAATGDPELIEAENRLADFLCRIQIRSEDHPELDGAWYRVFDFDKWEFWGSSADVGWGAWSIESGWTQGWITAVLAMRAKGTNLWDLTSGVDLRDRVPGVQALMAMNDGSPYVPSPAPIEHAAVGASYTLATPAHAGYPGAEGQLTDGESWPAWSHSKWLGWLGPDMVATIDLGEVVSIAEVGGAFMRNADIGIFLPNEIAISTSQDGETFTPRASLPIEPHTPGDRTVERTDIIAQVDLRARYVRIAAQNIGSIPSWHPSAGISAWLFCDELIVR